MLKGERGRRPTWGEIDMRSVKEVYPCQLYNKNFKVGGLHINLSKFLKIVKRIFQIDFL